MSYPTIPFLTLPDPEVAIKGSRDPLGYETIWTGLGRRIVSNLTTVTTSVRGFTTLMLGYYFASQIIDSSDREESDFISLFLKFEQIAAYSRYAWDVYRIDEGSDIRGIERVKKYTDEGRGKVIISSAHKNQILSEQRTYGLWGLYSVSAKNSGIINAETLRVTPEALEFIENEILPHFEKAGNVHKKIMDILAKDSYNLEPGKGGRDERIGRIIADLHKPAFTIRERDFYIKHLLFGNIDDVSFQSQFWNCLEKVVKKSGNDTWSYGFSRNELHDVILEAGESKLAVRLQEIDHLDWLLYITNTIFSYILGKHGFPVEDVVQKVSSYGKYAGLINVDALERLKPLIAHYSGTEHANRILEIAQLIRDNKFSDAVQIMIIHNSEIMNKRWGGGAWVVIKEDKLDVRFGLEEMELDELGDLNVMYSSYFLNSIKQIGKQLFGY